MSPNKMTSKDGQIYIDGLKISMVESIEIKSTSEKYSEVKLKFLVTIPDLNFVLPDSK
ncbi:hypothetical protein AB6905_16405 [Carnobacterium maltaromaticum]|uniref:hypothetical protein n=1 Tax=Carnobacterium maltaromaticum TaxID=2751 RepID=UPI0039BE0D02